MTIKRDVDWQSKLASYISEMETVPFSWEKHNDCAKFCAGAVKAMTGVDVMDGMRSYTSERMAKIILTTKGYRSHLDRLREVFEELPPGLAVAGDVGVMERRALGIVQGQYVYRAGATGVVLSDARDLKSVFRVPF